MEPAALAEMEARGYETSADLIGRHWSKASTMEGVLIRDHRYLPGGKLVEAKGWTSFWYVEETSLLNQLAESWDIDG